MQKITLDDLKRMDKEKLTPTDVGRFLGVDPYNITLQARKCPEKLGFNVCVIGTRTYIPRRAFIAWVEGRNEEVVA